MSNNNSNHSFFYLIFGIVIGGIVALLFAPKKGKDFRKSILSFLNDLQEKSANKFQNTSKDIKEIYDENKEFIMGDETETEIKVKEIIN